MFIFKKIFAVEGTQKITFQPSRPKFTIRYIFHLGWTKFQARSNFRPVILIHFRPYIFHHFRWPSQSNPLHAIHLHIYTVLNIMRIFHSGNRTRIRTRLWRIDSRLHFNFTGGILAKKEMESSSGSFTTDQPEFAPFFLYPADEDSEISAKCFH